MNPSEPPRRCRFCAADLSTTFVDLGSSPLCQTLIAPADMNRMEPFYPLHARVCEQCFLVQVDEYVSPADIFGDYPYFSSWTDSWVAHAKAYCDLMCAEHGIGANSLVFEVASNDGYLLQHFVARGVPVLGIEPAANVAEHARNSGVPTVTRFFGESTAADLVAEHGHADLVLGNNVLAHVPDLNDFVAGLATAVRPGTGLVTVEFPHLQCLMAQGQFDTIYHEHFSYFSLHHGRAGVRGTRPDGVRRTRSCRPTVAPCGCSPRPAPANQTSTVGKGAYHRASTPFARARRRRGSSRSRHLRGLRRSASPASKRDSARVPDWRAKRDGKSVVGYGAPGKGNTLLNYCGIRTDFLDYTVDRSPHKQGHCTPGARIPIHAPERLRETQPDYVLILPWNLREEITSAHAYIAEWGGRFVVPIPRLEVIG